MIDSRLPQSFLQRYGSWIAQLVPVALIRSHADLVTVLRSYSICLVLVHVVVFWFVAFRFRDTAGTVALPITLVAGLQLMFYYGTSELNQGVSLTVLVWVLMRRAMDATTRMDRIGWCLAALLLNVWTSFYHQVLVLPLIFAVGVELLERRTWREPWPWAVPGILVLWYVVRIKVFATSSYEAERMPGFSDVLEHLPQLAHLPSSKHLLEVYPEFKAFWALIVGVIALLVLLKRCMLAAWTSVFCTGLLVLILITDRNAGSPMMFENYYPVGALCLAMAAGSMFKDAYTRYPRAVSGSLVVVAFMGSVQVLRGHTTVSEKVAYAKRITTAMRTHNVQKGYLEIACFPWSYGNSTWQVPFETALVSAVEGSRRTATVFCAPHRSEVDSVVHKEHTFLGPEWMPLWFTTDHLNRDYFILDPGGYQSLNTVMPDSLIPAFPWGSIKLMSPGSPVRAASGRFTVVPIGVKNTSGRPLGCLSERGEPLRFRYALFGPEGKRYADAGVYSSLESDVPSGEEYPQGVMIERPSRNGRYRVDIRLSLEEPVVADPPSTSFWIDVR